MSVSAVAVGCQIFTTDFGRHSGVHSISLVVVPAIGHLERMAAVVHYAVALARPRSTRIGDTVHCAAMQGVAW